MQKAWSVQYCKSALHGIFSCEDVIELPEFVEFNLHELREWDLESFSLRIQLFVEVGNLSQKRMNAIKKVWATVNHPPSLDELTTVGQMINPKVSTDLIMKLVHDMHIAATFAQQVELGLLREQVMKLADFIAFFAAISKPVDDGTFSRCIQQILQRPTGHVF
jgi:hypothetical protein